MWNNRRAFTGPGGMALLTEVHHTSSESHTPHSHPFFKCFPALPVAVSDSQHATVPVQPATQPDVSSSSLLLLCCSFSPRLPEKWMEQDSAVCFAMATGIWWLVPKPYEKHLTKRGTGSKNTRHCLWDLQILPRKLKQSLALFTNIHLPKGSRLF